MSLAAFFDRYVPPLEKEMRAVVHTAAPRYVELFGMLRYHMGWVDAALNPRPGRSGKRVRPVLCLLICEACGGNWELALPAGAAIELMHNFTLIHDDIEDQDNVRRGRPTVWVLWGKAQGINAGDTLFALAHLALARLSERAVPPQIVLSALRLFDSTCVTLTSGQYLDIGFENRADVPVTDYLTMIEGKTAALVACACELGALIAAVPDPSTSSGRRPQHEHLHSFGHHLGMAFQMRDDVLGIWGHPTLTGKPVGADIARHKKSLPILHGLGHSAELRRLLARETLSLADIDYAKKLLQETGSREYTERLAREHHDQALAALEAASLQGPAAQALRELAQALLGRER
jgi:geranylgeranyl diphosphate synthase type I